MSDRVVSRSDSYVCTPTQDGSVIGRAKGVVCNVAKNVQGAEQPLRDASLSKPLPKGHTETLKRLAQESALPKLPGKSLAERLQPLKALLDDHSTFAERRDKVSAPPPRFNMTDLVIHRTAQKKAEEESEFFVDGQEVAQHVVIKKSFKPPFDVILEVGLRVAHVQSDGAVDPLQQRVAAVVDGAALAVLWRSPFAAGAFTTVATTKFMGQKALRYFNNLSDEDRAYIAAHHDLDPDGLSFETSLEMMRLLVVAVTAAVRGLDSTLHYVTDKTTRLIRFDDPPSSQETPL